MRQLRSLDVTLAERRLAQLALADDSEHRQAPMRSCKVIEAERMSDLVHGDILDVVALAAFRPVGPAIGLVKSQIYLADTRA